MFNTCCCGKIPIYWPATLHFWSSRKRKGMWHSQGRAPLSFCFSTKSRTGYRAPVVPKPQPGECDAPASGCQDGQLSLLAPSTLITVEGRRPDHLPSQADSRRLLMTLKAGTEKSLFSSLMSKNNRIQRISLHGVGTIPASVFTENKQLCRVPLWQVNAW